MLEACDECFRDEGAFDTALQDLLADTAAETSTQPDGRLVITVPSVELASEVVDLFSLGAMQLMSARALPPWGYEWCYGRRFVRSRERFMTLRLQLPSGEQMERLQWRAVVPQQHLVHALHGKSLLGPHLASMVESADTLEELVSCIGEIARQGSMRSIGCPVDIIRSVPLTDKRKARSMDR